MQSYKKNLIHISMLLALVALTFYILLQDQDMDEVILSIRGMNPFFLMLAMVLSLARIYGEAWSIYILVNSLEKEKISFLKCIKYSLCGFFFCSITPSASGGQPAQIYYMKKDGIAVANSSLALVVLTIIYRGTLVVFGGGIILFGFRSVYKNLGWVRFWFLLGLLINMIIVIAFCFLLFSKKMIHRIMEKTVAVLAKLHLVKKEEKFALRCDSLLNRYHKSARYISQHKSIMYQVTVINFLQRVLMFAATYGIYRGFGLRGESLLPVILLQSIVAICADMLPLPGGVGANEQCFISVFRRIFEVHTIPAMLLVRGTGFYMIAILSALLVCEIQIKEIGRGNTK